MVCRSTVTGQRVLSPFFKVMSGMNLSNEYIPLPFSTPKPASLHVDRLASYVWNWMSYLDILLSVMNSMP